MSDASDGVRLVPAALIAIALLIAACAGEAPAPAPGGDAAQAGSPVRRFDPPAGDGAFAPDLWSDDDGLLMTWLEPLGAEREDGHRVRFASFDGDAWSPPVTIVESKDLFANWADFPSPARAGDGTIYTHWLAKTADETFAYSIYLARSTDGGTSWEPVGKLNDDDVHTEHGFVSWVREGDALRAFWLDGREMPDGGPMTLRTATVGGATGSPVGPVELLDSRVCECCSTDAAVASAGPYVVYRDRSEEELRDVWMARWSGGGWSEPAAVWPDQWTIAGCPVNGPETDAEGELAVTAWFTAASDTARVKAALSMDGGASFREPVEIDADAPLGRVDAVLDGAGGAVVSWMARAGERAAVTLRRIGEGGAGEPLAIAETASARASGFPRMLRRGDSVVIAWVELGPDQPSRVRVGELSLASIPQ